MSKLRLKTWIDDCACTGGPGGYRVDIVLYVAEREGSEYDRDETTFVAAFEAELRRRLNDGEIPDGGREEEWYGDPSRDTAARALLDEGKDFP